MHIGSHIQTYIYEINKRIFLVEPFPNFVSKAEIRASITGFVLVGLHRGINVHL